MNDKKCHKVHYLRSESFYGCAEIFSKNPEDAERIFLKLWSEAEAKINRFENIRILNDKKEIKKWQKYHRKCLTESI